MGSNPFGLGIGSTVWMFGRNDTPEVHRIASETSRSWVVSDGQKIPKHCTEPVFDAYHSMVTARYCLTREAADALFLERQRWEMMHRVRDCGDTETLRAVAVALGMPTGVE